MPAGTRDAISDHLLAAGAIALAALPLAMALANRSATLLMCVAAGLLLAGRLAYGRIVLRMLRAPLASAGGAAALCLAAWCVASLAWSPFPATGAKALGEAGLALAAGYVVACLAPGRLPRWAPGLCAALAMAASLYLVASLVLGMAPQRSMGQRDALFVLNRPAIALVLLAVPVAACLGARREAGLRIGMLAMTAAAVLRTVSGAAALGLAAGLVAAVASAAAPRKVGIALLGTAMALAIALAPFEGALLDRWMPEWAHARLVHSSSRIRVDIAKGFGEAVAMRPVVGHGAGSSMRFAESPAAADVSGDVRPWLAIGHPHNVFLQAWVELGAVGAGLLAILCGLALRAANGLAGPARHAALWLMAATVAISFVEYGAWQGYWIAVVGAAVTWIREARSRGPHAAPA